MNVSKIFENVRQELAHKYAEKNEKGKPVKIVAMTNRGPREVFKFPWDKSEENKKAKENMKKGDKL